MDIKQFYDVNKRTQTEQVLKNQEDIDALKDKNTDIEQSIDDEANARVQADKSLAYDIAELQNQIEGLGNVFTLKGSVATYNDLPITDNHIGDVWYVEANAVGYVWIDDNGTQRWEQLGLPIDLSDYVTTSDLALALEDYQEKLTAGTNISIIDNVISASGGSNNAVLLDNSTQEFEGNKTFFTNTSITFRDKTNSTSSDKYAISFAPNNSNIIIYDRSQNALSIGCDYSLYARIIYKGKEIKLQDKSGTLALTSDIKKYYMHIIRNSQANSEFIIISTNSAQMTYSDVAQWLNSKGFTSSSLLTYTNGFIEFGVRTDGMIVQNSGYYSTDGINIKFSQFTHTPSVNLQTGTISYSSLNSAEIYSNSNFADTVVDL